MDLSIVAVLLTWVWSFTLYHAAESARLVQCQLHLSSGILGKTAFALAGPWQLTLFGVLGSVAVLTMRHLDGARRTPALAAYLGVGGVLTALIVLGLAQGPVALSCLS